MCGIGGIINLSKNSSKLSFKDISIIRSLLKKRGPDFDGNWISPNKDVIVTAQRLATQDGRAVANQPCLSSDKSVLAIMNGEIFNHNEIRSFLKKKNYIFKSKNDTEVVANAYHFWGNDFLKKLEGQFAIFVLDKNKNIGLLARDIHGISPLYYYTKNKKIIFSSTVESIFNQIKGKTNICKKGVSDFVISGCISDNKTFFNDIKYLSPGSYIQFKTNKRLLNPSKFLNNEELIKRENKRSNTLRKKIASIPKIIKKNVKKSIYGNKKVGIFLSGGIDSCLILAFYKKLYPKSKIETFTAIFRDGNNQKLIGEHKEVKKICKYFKCKNNLVKINSKDLIKFLKESSLPATGILEYCNKKLAEKAKQKKVEVILSGEGADEMFFGYDHSLALIGLFKKKYGYLCQKFKIRSSNKKINMKNLKIEDFFLIGGANIDLENNRKNIFSSFIRNTKSLRKSIVTMINKYNLQNPHDVDKIIQRLDYDIKIPELQIRRAEGVSMDQGVEMRFPFLNSELKTLMYTLDLKHKVDKTLQDKIILRKISEQLIPKKLLSPKQPFGLPAVRREYFKQSKKKYDKPAFSGLFFNNFYKIKNILLNGKYNELNIFNKKFIKQLIDNQSSIKSCFFDITLWRVFSFACWYERLKK